MKEKTKQGLWKVFDAIWAIALIVFVFVGIITAAFRFFADYHINVIMFVFICAWLIGLTHLVLKAFRRDKGKKEMKHY